MIEHTKHRKTYFLNPKNQVLQKFASLSSNGPINTNRRQILLTETENCYSKLSKVIQFEKKRSISFLIFHKSVKKIIKRTILLIYSEPLKVNFR